MGNKRLKISIKTIILIISLIIFSCMSVITFAWFKDKESYSGNLTFGTIELDITSGVVEATKTIDFDITRSHGDYSSGGNIMPGDTINIPLKIKLKNSEPAYYLVYLTDTKNVFEEAMYFSDDGTNVYVNNGIKTYKQGTTTVVTNKIVGKISGTSEHAINIKAEIPLSFNKKVEKTEVTCKIMAIQQANLTESAAFDEMDGIINQKVNFLNATNFKAVLTNYASLTSLGFFKKSDTTELSGFALDSTLTTSLDAKLDTNDKGKLEIWKKTDADIAFVSDGKIIANTSSSSLFNGCTELKNINLKNFYLPTSTACSIWSMFANCANIETLDLTNFKTDKVTSFYNLFAGCTKLTEIKIDSDLFLTESLSADASINAMFYNCSSLKSFDFSKFDVTKVQNFASMFFNCASLTELDLTSFDMQNATNWSGMFSGTFANSGANAKLKISSKFTYKNSDGNATQFTKATLNAKTSFNKNVKLFKDGVELTA